MFTWNLQYVSKTRLADSLKQLMIDYGKNNDILIRIHTSIHEPDDAVDLAAFIKSIVPRAHIFGTSTSAVINDGKLLHDQCIISITQVSEGSILSARVPTFDTKTGEMIDAHELGMNIKAKVVRDDTKLMLTFFTLLYPDVARFVNMSNELMPGVQMIGGVAEKNDLNGDTYGGLGFIFDENGSSDKDAIFVSISGEGVDRVTSFVSGAQVVGEELTITETDGRKIITIDDRPASQVFLEGVGDKIKENPQMGFFFPFVYTGEVDAPFMVGYQDDGLLISHNTIIGAKIKRAFIYDRKIISDNRKMFNKVESFDKAETIFGYSCRERLRVYPNSANWELSIYENSNMSGCLTNGEISSANGKNVFTNCSFVVSVLGEQEGMQNYNPYAFSHVGILAEDNRDLIDYLVEIESSSDEEKSSLSDSILHMVKEFEIKLLYSEKEGIANEAALNMDIKMGGYDRVCIIDVLDTTGMPIVFSEQLIEKTYNYYISRCTSFATRMDYRMYLIDHWKVAIAAPSYTVSLSNFADDMRILQKELFDASEEYISIVPVFCVINDCTVDGLETIYNSARIDMMHKNEQFLICDNEEGSIDEESIRKKYHMVNVINHALSNDKVIPYFQGIYDNKNKTIHHYESLMRLMDENGKVYYPGDFLDVARSFGLLYDSISKAMIAKVFNIFKDSKDKSVSINIGMRDIKNEDLMGFIYGFLATAQYPKNFVFEILENEDVDDYDMLLRFVDTIHKLGAKISIDDFGSGYSNLRHIADINSDFIKIDGSIVRDCNENKESENLVAIIAGWKKLILRNIEIVAEYVENEAIQEKLLEYGIDYSQGYLFSKPSPEIPELQ